MQLLSFAKNDTAALGVRRNGAIVDLAAAAPDLPADWPSIFAGGLLPRVEAAAGSAGDAALLPEEPAELLPPIPNPGRVICIGLNYREHAAETNAAVPDYPIVFARWPRSLVGHGQALVKPNASDKFDYEVELAVVIGTGGRAIPRARALDHVAGYSIINEGSVRDFQVRSSQWGMGKNFDASGSFGPHIVTADALPAGGNGLAIKTRVNGETLQDLTTADMIFDVADIIVALSEVMTLDPGDVIATGTPQGVAMGRTPPTWMKPGDTCEVEIEGIGVMCNPVVAEG